MTRIALPESKLRARRRRRALVLSLLLVALLAVIGGGLLWALRQSALRVSSVLVAGEKTVASSTIEAEVRESLTGNYFWFMPKDSILLYPRRYIERNLQERHPTFRSVIVHAESLSSISVAVEERFPTALWCLPAVPAHLSAQAGAGQAGGSSKDMPTPCIFLDDEGVAYALAPEFSGSAYVRYFGALPQDGELLPAQFISKESFRSLSAFVAALGEKTGGVESVAVEENGDVQAFYKDGFVLKFSLKDDTGVVFQHFTLGLASEAFQGRQLSDFQYLDLRFGDKLYYKLRR